MSGNKAVQAALQITLTVLQKLNSFCDCWCGEKLNNCFFSIRLHQWLYRNSLQLGDILQPLTSASAVSVRLSGSPFLTGEERDSTDQSLAICVYKAFHFYFPLLRDSCAQVPCLSYIQSNPLYEASHCNVGHAF